MKKILSVFVCGVLMCGAAGAQSCKSDAKDKAAVVETMNAMFAAAAVDDFAKLNALVMPGFFAFDGGKRYESMDALMTAVKAEQDQGVKLVWKVTKPQVTVECDNAWIAYLNDGSVQMPGASAPKPQQWLESAVMKKQDGMWKLVFVHSTRVSMAPASK